MGGRLSRELSLGLSLELLERSQEPRRGAGVRFGVGFTEVESGARSPQTGRVVGRIPQAQWAALDPVRAR